MKRFHVFADDIHPSALERLGTIAQVYTEFEKIPSLSDIDAVILRRHVIDRAEMLRMPKLKVISRHGVGMDTVDVAAARELRIPIVYTPYANSNAVVELNVGLILTALRYSDFFASSGDGCVCEACSGYELRGKTVGIIGIGRIGLALSRALQSAFSTRILGYHPRMSREALSKLRIEKAESLKELASLSDVVCLTVPLTEETRNMIDETFFLSMRPHAILINTSRGGIVDESALYSALQEHRIYAAACDVMLDEPVSRTHPLLLLDNFIGLPHIGANTQEAMYQMAMTAVEDVIAVLEGREPSFPYL